MTDTQSTPTLRASWYPDPDDVDRLRWWNGTAWTEHVQQLPPPPVSAAKVDPITDAFVIKTRVAETGTWYAETGNRPRSRPASPERAADADDESPASALTLAVIVIALMPAVAFVIEYFLTMSDDGHLFSNWPWLFWIVPVLFVVLNPALAALDRSALAERGITTAPSAIIALLPPVYFLLRAISVGSSSVIGLILWCIAVAAVWAPMKLLVIGFVSFVTAR